MTGVRDEEVSIRALQEVEEVAARQQPGGGGSALGVAELRLVRVQDDRVADRSAYVDERRLQRPERVERRLGADAGPRGEATRRAGAEAVQVATCELDAGVEWVELGRFTTALLNGLALRIAGGDPFDIEAMLRLLDDAIAPRRKR